MRGARGLGAPVGPMQNPEVEEETGKKSREEVQVSLLGSILVLKSFKALTLIGIPHQNMAIIVSIPNKVQKCHIRQNLVPQGQ